MKRAALAAVIGLVVWVPGASARTTIRERASNFAEQEARAESASGYLVKECRQRHCWVTIYGDWSPMVDAYADLSGWVVLPKRRPAHWRDFD